MHIKFNYINVYINVCDVEGTWQERSITLPSGRLNTFLVRAGVFIMSEPEVNKPGWLLERNAYIRTFIIYMNTSFLYFRTNYTKVDMINTGWYIQKQPMYYLVHIRVWSITQVYCLYIKFRKKEKTIKRINERMKAWIY